MAEAARIGPHVDRLGRVEQHAERLVIGPVLQQLDLVVLLGDHRLERVAAEQADAIHFADRRAVDPGDPARVAVARAAGDFDFAPLGRIHRVVPRLVRVLEEGEAPEHRAVLPALCRRRLVRHGLVFRREQPRLGVGQHFGDVALFPGVHPADPVFRAERPGDVLAQERPDGHARHPPHDLTQEEALVVHMVRGAGARLPQRLLHFQCPDVGRVVEESAGIHRVGGQHRDCRAVVEAPAHQDVFLPVLRELGPVVRDRLVDVDQALLDHFVEANAGHTLRDAHHADGRMLVPFLRAVGIRPAAPHIDHGFAVEHGRSRGAQLFLDLEILDERVNRGLKIRLEPPANPIAAAARLDRLVQLGQCHAPVLPSAS